MTARSHDIFTRKPSEQRADCLTTDDPPQEQWRLIGENYRAAQHALYAAKAQLASKTPTV